MNSDPFYFISSCPNPSPGGVYMTGRCISCGKVWWVEDDANASICRCMASRLKSQSEQRDEEEYW